MRNFFSGPGRDPDGDGLANMLERLLRLDPITWDSGALPKPWLERGQLVWRFTRSTAPGDAVAKLTASADLLSWTTEIPGLEVTVISEAAGIQFMAVQISAGTEERRFVRLQGELD